MLSPADEVAISRLHHELETTIRKVNHEWISVATGVITRKDFTDVARMVACLRGRYLQSVLKLGKETPSDSTDSDTTRELKPLRQAYTEAMEGFAALEHALQRGYISLAD